MSDKKRCPLGWRYVEREGLPISSMPTCSPNCAWFVDYGDGNGECCMRLMADTLASSNSAYTAARGVRPL